MKIEKRKEKEYLKIASIIADDFNKRITNSDKIYLDYWLNESEENKAIYNEIKASNWFKLKTNEVTKFKAKEGWEAVDKHMQKTTKKIKRIPAILKYAVAAIFIGAIATTYFLTSYSSNKQFVENEIEPIEGEVTLTLNNNSNIRLEEGKKYNSTEAVGNGSSLVYSKKNDKKATVDYNYITVPRGKNFYIKLSDGTQVFLNSESQLKYPTHFINGQARQVTLVYGEAYFDVSPSKIHDGSVFKVANKSQNVEVLGTEFNIKAYKNDVNVYTTLVEGKVKIESKGVEQLLKPNQQSIINQEKSGILLKDINVRAELSWRRGVFSFQNINLADITKVLSRWYNVEFVFETEALKHVKFKGVLKNSLEIHEILEIIKSTKFINNYEINDKIIKIE